MSCDCRNRKLSSEYDRIRELARKAAILEQCIYVIVKRDDGTYTFSKAGTEIKGHIVEYRHYL